MDVNGLRPYRNTVIFGRTVELAWCHDAIGYAIDYWHHLTEQNITSEELLKLSSTIGGMQALLYGAMRAGEGVTISEFEQKYQDENIETYIEAVADGLIRYLPKPDISEIDEFEEGDEAWPEVKKPKEIKKKARRTTRTSTSI